MEKQTPIEQAVAPLKQRAVDSARERALQIIENVRQDLEAHGWDINAAAPYPHASYTFQGQRDRAKHSLYHSITKTHPDHRPSYIPREPNYRVIDDERAAKFVEEMEAMAAAQYEAFVAKLVSKAGEHTAATLETPTGVWDYSYVNVTTTDGTVDRWKTQCISKYSKLGKFFHQWPTRKLKPGSKR